MKKLFLLLLLFVSFKVFAQPVVARSNGSITVQDFRAYPKLNFIVPTYLDTSAANDVSAIGLNLAGALIYTQGDQKYWIRKGVGGTAGVYWQEVGSGGGGGTVTAANEGLSLSSTTVQLGQTVNAVGDPAAFSTAREIPLNNLALRFRNGAQGASPDNNLTVDFTKTGAGNGDGIVNLRGETFGSIGFKYIGLDPGHVRNQVENTNTPTTSLDVGINYNNTAVGFTGRNTFGGQIIQLYAGSANNPFADSTAALFGQGVSGLKFAANNNGFIKFTGAVLESGTEYGRFAATTGYLGLNTILPTERFTVNGNIRLTAAPNVSTPDSALFIEDGIIKAGLASSGINVYNSNGTLTSDRTITGDDKNFNLVGASQMGFQTTVTPGGRYSWLFGDSTQAIMSTTFGSTAAVVNTALADEGGGPFNDPYVNIGTSGTGTDSRIHIHKDRIELHPNLGNLSIADLTHNNTNKLTVLVIDTTDNRVYHIPQDQIIGATPTLQQVITAGSTFSQINTYVGSSFPQIYTFNSLAGVGDAGGAGFQLSSNSTTASGDDQTLLKGVLSGANAASDETTYTARFENLHTGTGSTNIAGSFYASGGTNNVAIHVQQNGGYVGLGTDAPNYFLDIQENRDLTFAASITNNSTTGAGLGVNTFSTGTNSIFQLLSGSGGADPKFGVRANGEVRFNDLAGSSGQVLTSGGAGVSPTWETPSAGSNFTFPDSLKVIDAYEYGVVFDGVTDNITALRAMRDAAATTGWPMRFGPGVITASDSVTFNEMTLVGNNTTIKTTSTTLTIFNLSDSNHVSGFTFIGTGKAASIPGGVFTLQNGLRIFGDANNIHDCIFTSMNGSGITLWASSTFHSNNIYNNRFNTNTIGVYAMTNSEYTSVENNTFEDNYVGGYDRSSSNNQWKNNQFKFDDNACFRLRGDNADHGRFVNNTVNHGGTYGIYIENCTNDYLFDANDIYSSNIGVGVDDTAHDVQFSNNVIANSTISGAKNVRVRFINNIYSVNVTESTTGVDYFNNLNSSDPTYVSTITGGLTSAQLALMLTDESGTAGNALFSGSPTIATPTITTSATVPLIIGGPGTTSDLILQTTSGVGATGAEFIVKGGNNGATTFLTISNAGEWGIGTAPATGFKTFIVTTGNNASTTAELIRNSSSQNIRQQNDLGSLLIGNQSTGISQFNVYGTSYFGNGSGAAITPTARLHIAAGATGPSTAPLKLTTGTNNTTAEAGAFEYTTPQLFFTNGTAVRQEIQTVQQSRVSTQYDNTTTTLGNITGLTANVAASGTYRFEAILYTTSNVGGGVKFAVAGTATATAIVYEAMDYQGGVGVATGTQRAAAMATVVGDVTAVTTAYVRITGTITVNAAGTLTLQAAANTAVGTTSVLVGSTFVVNQIL